MSPLEALIVDRLVRQLEGSVAVALAARAVADASCEELDRAVREEGLYRGGVGVRSLTILADGHARIGGVLVTLVDGLACVSDCDLIGGYYLRKTAIMVGDEPLYERLDPDDVALLPQERGYSADAVWIDEVEGLE